MPLALVACVALVLAATSGALASPVSAAAGARATAAQSSRSSPPQRRVFLLGLRQRGTPARLASQVSDPSSPSYRDFLTLRQYRKRFAPSRADRRRVRRYLSSRSGVRRLEASADKSLLLVVTTPAAGRRLFCASGAGPPTGGLCLPRVLRGPVRQLSAGELYQVGSGSSRRARPAAAQGCPGAIGELNRSRPDLSRDVVVG